MLIVRAISVSGRIPQFVRALLFQKLVPRIELERPRILFDEFLRGLFDALVIYHDVPIDWLFGYRALIL